LANLRCQSISSDGWRQDKADPHVINGLERVSGRVSNGAGEFDSCNALLLKDSFHDISNEHFVQDPIQAQKLAVPRFWFSAKAKCSSQVLSDFARWASGGQIVRLLKVRVFGLRIPDLPCSCLMPVHSIALQGCQ